jgi:hypothetical protein
LFCEAFAGKHEDSFSRERFGKNHDIVLVGWKQTEDGEFWFVKAPIGGAVDEDVSSDDLFSIPVRQYGVVQRTLLRMRLGRIVLTGIATFVINA